AGNKWQMREVNAQSGFGGQSSFRQHFGFGLDAVIDSLQIIWPSGQVQNLTNQLCNQFLTITEPSASELKGITYSDLNNNCIKDANEPVAPFSKIRIQPGNRTVISDGNGAYAVWLETNSYTIAPLASGSQVSNCGNRTLSVTGVGQQLSNINFGFTYQCQDSDLEVYAGATAFRRGFTLPIRVELKNKGIAKANNVSLTTVLDPEFVFKSAVPAPTTVTKNAQQKTVLTWLVDSLSAGQTFQAEVWDSLSVRSTINSLVGLSVSSTMVQPDCDLTNNTFSLIDTVVGAIDPNDIITFTPGLGDARLIANTETIKYKIRFQNVGNHLASRVIVSNQLPLGFDINTLNIEGTSHLVKTTVKGNNLLEFRFDNIELPDSNSNEPESHGWIMYSIKPKVNLSKGTELSNSAAITFDYEDPIFTNTLTHTIWGEHDSQWAVNVNLMPNPAQFQTTVSLVSNDPLAGPMAMETITIQSVGGKVVQSYNANGTSEMTLPIQGLESGIYIVEVKAFGGKKYFSRLVVTQ
ncbi:MAG: DUF7619 domain-containing protein, partial [Flexibacteraceae bacterium]